MKDPRPDDIRDPLLPRDWAELAPLVDRILDAAPETRPALVLELGAGDPLRTRSWSSWYRNPAIRTSALGSSLDLPWPGGHRVGTR